ncbi:hypothetical protein L3Q82_010832, partial [Scortum barcoo]
VETVDSLNQKNDPLLNLLKSVYVESNDPAAAEVSVHKHCVHRLCPCATKEVMESKETDRRPLKFSVPGDLYGMMELTDVPKGKLTIAEALKALNSHQRQPQTWTPEKIAQDYSLDLKDTKSLLEFFIPFQIQIIPPKTAKAKQIRDS